MSDKNVKTGIGWGFFLVFVGVFVLILDGVDTRGKRVSFSLDDANPEVIALATALILGGAGLRLFPEKAGEILPGSKALEKIGEVISGKTNQR